MNSRSSSSCFYFQILALMTLVTYLFILVFWKSNSSIFFSTSPRDASSRIGSSRSLKVYVATLPREFNFGLLQNYWKNGDHQDKYPEEPLFKQHSAEYWLLRSLQRPWNAGVIVTKDSSQADVVFLPFFAALSAQLQLRGPEHGNFRKKDGSKNRDYERQRRVVDLVKQTPEWKRSGGRDHVFVLADPMAMWHVRHEISDSIFLVVDFGAWYKEDTINTTTRIIQHTEVSLVKDVVVPHTHLLPSLSICEDQPRNTILYFRGARHRHRGGLIRDKLWTILENEVGVVLESGLPDSDGLEEATKGMRSSEFCLNPAGDTPNSCRLYDSIASLCIPVIVSDDIVLPFEGILNYTRFSIFVSNSDALRPGFLVDMLKNVTTHEKNAMRNQLSKVQQHFEYDDQFIHVQEKSEGAVGLTWRKVKSKVPLVKEAVSRYQRSSGLSSPATTRCHCVS